VAPLYTPSACVPLTILRSWPQGLKAKLGPRVGPRQPPPALGLLLLLLLLLRLSQDLLDLSECGQGELQLAQRPRHRLHHTTPVVRGRLLQL
jgi:hypothetical protein